MLMFTPEMTRMILLLWAFMVITAAQPRCDPQTQYEKDGQCCKMCEPGTHMSALGSCQVPLCVACGEDEYQDKYTNEYLCQKQLSCNERKNFQKPVHDTKKKTVCLCKEGFHCSSDECFTCVPHRTCEPGHGVKQPGSQKQDTVCEKCPEGKFSNESSWSDVCTDWTKCENGFQVKQAGTDTTDTICEKSSRTHVIVVAVLLTLILALVIAVLVYWKRSATKGKLKDCVECLREKKETPKANVLITTPTEPTDEEEILSPADLSCQEEGLARSPEENEDDQRTTSGGFTENGNFVTQENGKSEVLSRQESQTQAFTD